MFAYTYGSSETMYVTTGHQRYLSVTKYTLNTVF